MPDAGAASPYLIALKRDGIPSLCFRVAGVIAAGTSPSQHPACTLAMTFVFVLKAEGAIGSKPKRTIADIVERLNVGRCSEECLPTSPRSVEACLRLGVDPWDLVHKPLEEFKNRREDVDIARYRHRQYEAARRDLIQQLMMERQKLMDSQGNKGSKRNADRHDDANDADIVEKEKRRLEVLKRRQERELSQMLNHEEQRLQMMTKQRVKVEAVERRAAEMRKKKIEKDILWKQKQRERELHRMKEMEAIEAAAKLEAHNRFQKEQQQQKAEEAEALLRKQQAVEQEKRHREKAERARIESQRILEEQQEAVRRRRLEIEKRDIERQRRINLEQKERAIANQIQRRQAQERFDAALEKDRRIQEQKQLRFQKREALSNQRRAALERARAEDDRKRKHLEKQKEESRKQKIAASQQQEQARTQALKEKTASKDRMLEELRRQQQQQNAYAAVEREMRANMKRDKAERMRKIQIYRRQLLFRKIMDNRNKIARQLEAKEKLQRQRRLANMQASMERQRLNAMMTDMARLQTKCS